MEEILNIVTKKFKSLIAIETGNDLDPNSKKLEEIKKENEESKVLDSAIKSISTLLLDDIGVRPEVVSGAKKTTTSHLRIFKKNTIKNLKE